MIKDLWDQRRKILKEIEAKKKNSPIGQIDSGLNINNNQSRSGSGSHSKTTQGCQNTRQKKRNLSKG